MAPTWIESDSNTNKDISSAASVGVYTSTGDKFVLPQLLADQVAGNGDYVYYVTLQVAGAGSHYVIGPKTTHAAASGETAIGAQGGFIAVRSGDVLTVYVDGLAGDTATPDVVVRWFELDASANVTFWKGTAAPDAPPSVAQFEARTLVAADYVVVSDLPAAAPSAASVADAVWDELLSGHAIVGSTGAALTAAGAAGDPWSTALPGSYDGGTAGAIIGGLADIDTSSVSVVAAISGTTITVLRGDTLTVTISGLGDISTRTKLWFTAKADKGDADTAAIVQIEETAGLVRLNGAAGTALLGDITVTDEDAGDITITLDETATDDLVVRSNMSYDVQMLTLTAVTTLTSGTLHVTADVTRAVA